MSQLFSIAIPAYKTLFLRECINSVLKQTYPHFELIILNDCSPEPVASIVDEFLDARIRYFNNDINIGAENLVVNWNRCLEIAKGDFFVIMSDDDRMETNYLEEFVSLINRYPNLDIYHCRSLIIDEDSIPISLTPSWSEYESIYDCIWHRISGLRLQYISDFVYRTSALKELGGFYSLPLAWASDDISAYRSCGDKGIAHINKPIFNYRLSRYTISTSGNGFLKMSAIKKEEEWLKIFLEKSPRFGKDAIIHEDICRILDKYILKKKILTIAISLQNNSFLFSSLKWWTQRKYYGLTTLEIFYSIVKCVKRKYVESRF